MRDKVFDKTIPGKARVTIYAAAHANSLGRYQVCKSKLKPNGRVLAPLTA